MKLWNLYMKQSGLTDVMHKLFYDCHYVSAFWLYVFTLHCINSIFIILLMSICISVLLVWISIKMFKPHDEGRTQDGNVRIIIPAITYI